MPDTPIRLYMTNFSASANNPNAPIGDIGFGAGNACNHGALSLTSVSALTTWGWNVGTLAAPRVVQMDFGTEVSRTATTPNWQITSRPALQPISASIGDCWVYGPLEGEFDASPWYVTQSVKATTNASTQLGRFLWLFYRADNQQGSGSVLLSASYVNSASTAITDSIVYSSICTSLASVNNRALCSQSFSLGRQVFRRQFLVIQTYWNITTAGGNNNADVNWVLAPNSSSITTAKYIPYHMSPYVHQTDDFG